MKKILHRLKEAVLSFINVMEHPSTKVVIRFLVLLVSLSFMPIALIVDARELERFEFLLKALEITTMLL